MKKVFLVNFSSPALVEAAKRMQSSGSIDVLYWLCYREGFEEAQKNKDIFPNAIMHHIYDAIKCIPPKGVNIDNFDPIDKEIIEKCQEYAQQILVMLGRADYEDSTLVKKRSFYYSYLKFFKGMIGKYNPDYILFYDIPHGVVDFTLYGLAKVLGIKTLILHQPTIEGRVMIMEDYKKHSEELHDEYARIIDQNLKADDLPSDLKEYYQIQTNPNIDSTPSYSKKAMKNRPPFSFPGLGRLVKSFYNGNFFKKIKYFFEMFFTRRQSGTIHQDMLGIEMKLKMIKWQRQNESVKKEYESLQIEPDMSKKFIYFPLHFQAEQSTLPMGGVYDDQFLAIEILSKAIPSDWVIYVKESPLQWLPFNIDSRLYRYAGYYKKIAKLKNVFLVSVETPSQILTNSSKAVATITGTAAWEAVMRSKPSLLFGYNWHMYCDGVFKINNLDDCKMAIKKIYEGFLPSSQKVINFLHAFSKVTALAPYYKIRKFPDLTSKKIVVENISQLITSHLI